MKPVVEVADGSEGYPIAQRGCGLGCRWGAVIGAFITSFISVADRAVGELGLVIIAAPVGAAVGAVVGLINGAVLAAYESAGAHPDRRLRVIAGLCGAALMTFGSALVGPTTAAGRAIGLVIALIAAAVGGSLAPRVVHGSQPTTGEWG